MRKLSEMMYDDEPIGTDLSHSEVKSKYPKIAKQLKGFIVTGLPTLTATEFDDGTLTVLCQVKELNMSVDDLVFLYKRCNLLNIYSVSKGSQTIYTFNFSIAQ